MIVFCWSDDAEKTPIIEEFYMGTFRECHGTRHIFKGMELRIFREFPLPTEWRAEGVVRKTGFNLTLGEPAGHGGGNHRIFIEGEKHFFQGKPGLSNAWWSKLVLTSIEFPGEGYSGYRKVPFYSATDSNGCIKLGS